MKEESSKFEVRSSKLGNGNLEPRTSNVEQRQGGALPSVHCPACGQRLFDGWLVGEIKCRRCKRIVKFIAKKDVDAYITEET